MLVAFDADPCRVGSRSSVRLVSVRIVEFLLVGSQDGPNEDQADEQELPKGKAEGEEDGWGYPERTVEPVGRLFDGEGEPVRIGGRRRDDPRLIEGDRL